MHNRLFIFALVIILIFSLTGTISNAESSIPKGLKSHYNYNTNDKSIMPVKHRLYELGYCDETDISSAWLNNRLKTAVTHFQMNNGLEANGEINKDLYSALFSPSAINADKTNLTPSEKPVYSTAQPSAHPSINTDNKTPNSTGNITPKNANAIPRVFALIIVITVSCIFIVLGILSGIKIKAKRKEKAVKHNSESITNNKQITPERNNTNWNNAPRFAVKHDGINRIQSLQSEAIQKPQAQQTQQQREQHNQTKTTNTHQQQINEQRAIAIRMQQEKERQKINAVNAVKTHSLKYQQLQKLFTQYNLTDGIPTEFSLSYVFSNRYSFDHVDSLSTLATLAEQDKRLMQAYETIGENREKMKKYLDNEQQYQESPSICIQRTNLTRDQFMAIEKELCKALEFKVRVDMSITMYLYYRNGGKHALQTFTYNYNDLQNAFERKQSQEISYIDIYEERSKMTPSLRYQILKRDGFRCTICGANAEDGVKLHVDHIMPVSKGGKTEENNLRTLCDRCNMGKGDQYDPDGLN